MRKIIITLALCMLGAITLHAQDDTEHSVSIEGLGVHNVVGINFDSRFKGSHGFGFRVGAGYTQGTHAYISPSATKVQGVAFPLEINYLLGQDMHKLELGLGCSLGYYGERIEFPEYAGHAYWPTTDKSFAYFVFGNIGYRLQTKRGLMIRAGWAPSINYDDTHSLRRRPLTSLYLGIGWRLK